jgi:prevent-host-death family protein
MAMRKTVSAMRARGKLGQILEEVFYRGDQYIIERSGKPMAAVVPVEQYDQWRQEREAFFKLVEELRGRNRGARPAEIEADIAAARRAVRKRR